MIQVSATKDQTGVTFTLHQDTYDPSDPPFSLAEALEWLTCNSSWEFIRPEEIGALTNAPILSDDATRDDQGGLVTVGRVYWFPDYQIRDELAELLETGSVRFPTGG